MSVFQFKFRSSAVGGIALTAAVGVALSVGTASAASSAIQLGGKDRCDPVGPVSVGFYDARKSALGKGAQGVTYERTADGDPRRTIYLEGGGYVVSVCDASGVHEERYQPIVPGEKPKVVSIFDVTPDGKASGKSFTYAEPTAAKATPAPTDKRIVPRPPGDAKRSAAESTVVTPKARAIESRDLKPGDATRMTGRRAADEPAWANPSQPPVSTLSYSAANKCYHQSGVDMGVRRSPRSFTYYSGLGAGYAWILVPGARAFPDVWNYCGWTTGSGLDAVYGGEFATFTIGYDGYNQIGWDYAQTKYCGANAIGCNYLTYVWDAAGYYRLIENDIAIDPTASYAAGAVPGYVDFQSLIAHEFGHSWGFGDFYEAQDPYGWAHVMFGVIPTGVDDRRYLAYGDYQLMRNMYP